MGELEISDKSNKEALDKILEPITNPKKQGGTFRTRLMKYNYPVINVVFGFFTQFLVGFFGPAFGVLIIKTLFSMIKYVYDPEQMRKSVDYWVLLMFIAAIICLLFTFLSKWAFGIVGENITINIRRDLYNAIMRKDIGWHDDQNNAAGILSSILAADVQKLNGVSTEGLSVTAEAMSSMVAGLIFAFCFSWQTALIALAFVPFMMVGAALQAAKEKANI